MSTIVSLAFASILIWQIIIARSRGELVALIISGFGIGCFLAPSLLNDYKPSWTDYIEFPNAEAKAWVHTRSGHIYLGSHVFGRIQKYAADGRFERGWFVDVAGGAYGLSETLVGTILICGVRINKSVEFTVEGVLIAGSDKPCDYRAMVREQTQTISRGFGVVNITDGGNRQTISIHAPIALFPLWSPIVGWLIFMSGGLLHGFARASDLPLRPK